MNKRLLILVIVISSVITLKAQDYTRPTSEYSTYPEGKKKFSLGISIGPSIPFRNFGSTNVKGSFWDFTSPDSTHLQGFAKTGFHFSFYMSYLFSDNAGIMVMFGTGSNLFDINTFSSTIKYPSTSSTGTYGESEYLIGPYISIPQGPKLRIQLSALIGVMSISYPEVTTALNDTLSRTVDFQGGSGFAYSLAAGIAYNLNDYLDLLLNVTYTGSNINYDGWVETYNAPGYYPLVISHNTCVATMTTGILKPTIGLVVKF